MLAKRVISSFLISTLLFSAVSMRVVCAYPRELSGVVMPKECGYFHIAEENFPLRKELPSEKDIVEDLSILTSSRSLENSRAGLFTELFAAVMCVGWLIYDVIIPLGTLVLVGGVLIYAAVADSKGE